jgi:hypothetical protein
MNSVIFSGVTTNEILVVIPDLIRTHPERIGEHHPQPHWFFSRDRGLTVRTYYRRPRFGWFAGLLLSRTRQNWYQRCCLCSEIPCPRWLIRLASQVHATLRVHSAGIFIGNSCPRGFASREGPTVRSFDTRVRPSDALSLSTNSPGLGAKCSDVTTAPTLGDGTPCPMTEVWNVLEHHTTQGRSQTVLY